MVNVAHRADHSKGMIRALSVLSIAFATSVAITMPAKARERPAPVFEGSSQTYSAQSSNRSSNFSTEDRLNRIERRLENQTVVEMITRFDNLQQEMQRLVGEIEVLNHQIGGIKKRQRDLYLDIDRRIGKIENNKGRNTQNLSSRNPFPSSSSASMGNGSTMMSSVGAPSMGNSSRNSAVSYNSPAPGSNKLAAKAYERAFNLLRDGRYDLAIASFKAYLESYPRAGYADNAQYWLGEANYANQRYEVALTEFNRVLDNYPKSKKVPDAMLKIGYSYGELGKGQQAKDVLNNIISVFPDSTAARLAKKRITSLKRRR